MATKSLGQLTLDLIARIGGFTAPMDQASRKSKKTAKDIKDSAKDASAAWKSLGSVVAGAFVGVSAGALFTRFITETKAAEKEQAQLAAVLKSTGNAAGYTQDQLNGMADELESITAFSGGDFAEAQISLLAFTGVVGEQFPRALSAAADMAERTGVTVKQSAETIGRALDVPTKGLAALSKQGFRFTEDQKKVIKQLEETGRVAEAQGIILDELEKTYGGAAAAARDTFAGSLGALSNTIDNLLTGEGSLDSAKDAINDLNGALTDPATREGISQLVSGLITAGTELTEFLAGTANFAAWFGEEIAAMIEGIGADDVVRLEQRAEQIKASMDGIWSAFSRGGTSDFFTSNEELQKQLDVVNAMIADFYERQKSVANIKSGAAAMAPTGSTSSVKAFSEYNNSGIEKGINEQLENRVKIQRDLYVEAEKLAKSVNDQADAYRRQISLTEEATELEKLHADIAYGSLVGINAEQQKLLENLAAQADQHANLIENEKKIADLRKEFAGIHEDALESGGKLIDLENYRSQLQRENLQKEMDELKAKGAWTAEIEAEAQTALEEQEQAHQDRIKQIRDQAEADEIKRRQIQLAGVESLFDSLGDLTEAFGEKNSRLRKTFLIAEKAAAIASATIAIQKGIAEAAGQPFPANIVAMGTVAAQTAGILTTIKGVNIAHGGLDYVPSESTYLLDKGERVLSPRQNTDLTAYLSGARADKSMRIEVINTMAGVPIAAQAEMGDDGTLKLIITAVKNDLRQDLSNGRGIWGEAKQKYGWSTKGSI